MNREERKIWYYEQTHKIIDGQICKQCTQCKEWKPETVEYFYMRNKSKPEKGFNAECKRCSIEKSMEWVNNNLDKHKFYMKKEIAKESTKERVRKWNVINRENGKYNEWQNNNKEKLREYNEKRQHKNHRINNKEWYDCKQYFNNACAYCGMTDEEHRQKYKEQLHREHVDHEGLNDLSNCVPSCKVCNSEKHKSKLEDWYNSNNIKYSKDKYEKIINWINEDYKQYIVEKKPKKSYKSNKNKLIS